METGVLKALLEQKSTTSIRTAFDKYCKSKGYQKWDHNEESKNSYYSEYDCKRRLRTICRLYYEGHMLIIALRKKAGYYFIIEYDHQRIFECDPDILVLDQEKLDFVTEKYKELFGLLTDQLI